VSHIGPARKSSGTIPPGGGSPRPESQPRKLRNVYACLVHESQECVVDLVRNLRCLDPDSTANGVENFKQGMTNGFADRYTWDLPAQFVEASHLGNGLYRLETTVNPEHRLLEASYANNCVVILVQLTGMGTDAPTATIVTSSGSLSC